MGTTADKLEYLSGTKDAIKQAIVDKGVAVPDGTTFRGYAGKIASIEDVGSLPTQGAKTVTPTTTEQVAVSSGRYTTGDVKVAGDANLVPENIAEGVSIFGVQGTHSGGGGAANVTFICEIGANSEINPTSGIFIITPEGQPQQVNLDVGETKIVQVAVNSFMLPALFGDWDGAGKISGNAYIVENALLYTNDYHLSRLVYVYGDCIINV